MVRSESCLESDNFALRSEVVAMVKQIPWKIRGKLTRTGESGKLQAWRLYLYQWWPTQILVNVAWSPHARGPQKTSWQIDAKAAKKGIPMTYGIFWKSSLGRFRSTCLYDLYLSIVSLLVQKHCLTICPACKEPKRCLLRFEHLNQVSVWGRHEKNFHAPL